MLSRRTTQVSGRPIETRAAGRQAPDPSEGAVPVALWEAVPDSGSSSVNSRTERQQAGSREVWWGLGVSYGHF